MIRRRSPSLSRAAGWTLADHARTKEAGALSAIVDCLIEEVWN
jgi:hypothetical protein